MRCAFLKTGRAFATIIVLLLSLNSLLMTMPTTEGADPVYVVPVAWAEPDLIELGQAVTIYGFAYGNIPPTVIHDCEFNIVLPGGSEQSFGPYDSNTTGYASLEYIPPMVGNYTVWFYFPSFIYGQTSYVVYTCYPGQFTVVQTPTAFFTYSPVTPEKNEPVTFDASGSHDPDGTIVEYVWNFGDENVGSGKTPSHSYETDDTYTVELTITDNDGQNATYAKQITIGAGATPITLTALASPTSTEVTTGQQATFTASASGGAPPYTYQWYEGKNAASGETNTQLKVTKNSPGTYTYYCAITDSQGNKANSSEVSLTVTAPPLKAFVIINNDTESTDSTAVTLNLAASDSVTEMRFSNDGVEWSNWQQFNTSASWTLTEGSGNKTVYVQFRDEYGQISTLSSDTITLNDIEAGFPLWIIALIAAVIIIIVVVFFFLKKRKPKEEIPKPAKIRVTVDPHELLADGASKASVMIELLDSEGKPVSAVNDTEIKLTSTMGKIEEPLAKIPKGKERGQSLLVSSKHPGTVTLSADAKGLEGTSITVAFSEKKRYCMHCGAKMKITSKRCPKCDSFPPSGTDTKQCKNCNSILPVAAKFCAECGANQPEQE